MCFSCVLACQVHSLGLRQVRDISPGARPQPKLFLSVAHGTPWVWKCRHCSSAPCVEACISGSMRQRENGEGVEHRRESCVGCGSCLLACPFGMVDGGPESNLPAQCDICPGEPIPPCVRACQSQALVYQDLPRFIRGKRRRFLLHLRGD